MAHISRQELKSDEFVSGMDAALEYFLQNKDRLIILVVVVAVAAGLGYGGYAWWHLRGQKAEGMLAAGLDTLHAPLLSSNTPQGVAAFASVQTRAAAAAKQFAAVASEYPSTTAGQLGRYYLGLAQLDLNDPAAEKTLQAAANSGNGLAATAAKHALANVYIRDNKVAQAHDLLTQLARQDSPTLPKSVAILELANLDRSTNPAEAAKYYHQLETDYPNSSTAQQATQALSSLGK